MVQTFINIWKVKDLRYKLMFTIGMLAVYRLGFFIPLPGVDQEALRKAMENAQQGAFGNLLTYMQIFSGGSLMQSTIFGLGIMPYISAAIIFQLLGSVYEPLKKIQKEGPSGRQKIQEYTRYATLGLCLVQATFWVGQMFRGDMIYSAYTTGMGPVLIYAAGITGLTAGTIFLMWLGEQIDKYGIGNGISLIITAGIFASMDDAIMIIVGDFKGAAGSEGSFGWDTVLILLACFVFVTAGAVVITQGQRRIPIQQGKHTRGRRVYGGQRTFLPLRINQGGVMPIIFASSLMLFPSVGIGMLDTWMIGAEWSDKGWTLSSIANVVGFLNDEFMNMTGYLYALVYIVLIYVFSYFWTSIQFQPEEVATQLRDSGSFIPGLRPGPRTAEYLETVMERVTYVGAGFLCVIAIVPTIISASMGVPYQVTQFLGGTGLLIGVSVMLDFVQRIEASLLMRNYEGFLDGKGSK